MATNITVWTTQTGGAFQDAATTQRWLNVTRRNFVLYGLAQNLPKISPLAGLLLKNSDTQPFQPDFIIQPVYGGLTGTDLTSAQPQWVDATAGTVEIRDFKADVMYAKYTPSILGNAIRFGMFEQAVMQSPLNIIDLLAIKATEVFIQLLSVYANTILGTRGTDDKKFYGLLDLVDNGTAQPTYAQIDRATYPWWNSPIYDYSAIADANLPVYMNIKRVISKYAKEHGHIYGMPHVAVTDFSTFQKVLEGFINFERYIVGEVSNIAEERGYRIKGIDIDGIALFPDPYLTTYTEGTNTYGRIFFLNLDHIRFTTANPFEFYMTDWNFELINGRLSYVSAILLAGQFWTDKPRAHFRIDRVPTLTVI